MDKKFRDRRSYLFKKMTKKKAKPSLLLMRLATCSNVVNPSFVIIFVIRKKISFCFSFRQDHPLPHPVVAGGRHEAQNESPEGHVVAEIPVVAENPVVGESPGVAESETSGVAGCPVITESPIVAEEQELSDEEQEDELSGSNIVDDLRRWKVEHYVTHAQMGSLLKVCIRIW